MGRMTGSQRRAAWREKFASTRTSTGRNTTSTTNSATEAVPETTGSTQQTTQVGAKRDSNYGNPKLLSYPLIEHAHLKQNCCAGLRAGS